MTKSIRSARFGLFTLGFAVLVLPTLALAQAPAPAPTTIAAALSGDVGTLSDKFTGLAKAMAGKYDWKPAENVRSAGDVFNLIVNENKMLAGALTGAAAPGGPRPAPITDPAQLEEALKTSYAALREAVAGLSDSDLNASVRMFGRETTKRGAVLMVLFDQHEHLGQSIAYARSNGIAPPWSKGAK